MSILCLALLLLLAASSGSTNQDGSDTPSPASSTLGPPSLLLEAERDFARGAYQDGLLAASEALAQAEHAGDPLPIAAALLVRANLLLAFAETELAVADLERVLESNLAKDSASLLQSVRLNLANAHAIQGNGDAALKAYREIYEAALESDDAELAARAAVNRGRVRVDAGTKLAEQEVKETTTLLDRLPDSPEKALLLIHFGVSQLRSIESGVGDRAKLIPAANTLFRAALGVADTIAAPDASPRLRGQALGNLAALYALEGRLEDALGLTQRALQQTSQSDVPAELFFWHHQAARLHRMRGDRGSAIEAYDAALGLLEENRGAISRAQKVAQGQRESVTGLESVYREYVDLLLSRARERENEADRTRDLLKAQATLERLKSDELRDYFEDECVTRYQEKLTSVQSGAYDAAIVYPFVLEDRLELLVSAGGRLEQIVVSVGREELRATVDRLRVLLEDRRTRAYLRPARQIYDWLVRPIEGILEQTNPETLVFVPDGILRTIPMAVLHDGDQFLIERIPLGITPGLELTDPTPVPDHKRLALFAGISEAVDDFAALPSVKREIDALHEKFGGERLLDVSFSRRALTERIREKPFRLVHIASHAEFGSTAAGGFVLAHDGPMSFDVLADALASTRLREDPLDLIILSACETAEGSSRAALGLSGIAVKAGARSALGTLWRVDDEATSDFMIRFHTSLAEPKTSRARAVQAAQLALMNDPRFSHPYYWSAYLLINSWL